MLLKIMRKIVVQITNISKTIINVNVGTCTGILENLRKTKNLYSESQMTQIVSTDYADKPG